MGLKTTLDEYFIIGKSQIMQFNCINQDLLYKIIKDHGMLSHSFARAYGKKLHRDEALSYFFEALPIAISEFNPCKGKAGTALTLVFCRLMSAKKQAQNYIGTVNVPVKNFKFSEFRLDILECSDLSEKIILEGLEYASIKGKTEGQTEKRTKPRGQANSIQSRLLQRGNRVRKV